MNRLRQAFALALVVASAAVGTPRTTAQRTAPPRVGGERASLLLLNGKIFVSDENYSIAQAVAVEGERIIAVGTNEEIRSRYVGARTIDLQGRLVTPGFNDAHLHFLNGGLSLVRVNFAGATTLAEAKRRIALRAKELPAGAWVLGRGWDHTLWGGEWPRKEDIDEVVPDKPVFVQRVDGHVSWANSLALKLAGVTRDTPNPEGGEILRDARGEPTGILKETAAGLVARVVPDPPREEKLQAIERALAEARRYGITSVSDSISGYELKRQREEFNSLKVDPFRIRISAVKGYVDGTLGSRTAAMLAPFSDDPANSGIPRMTQEELTRKVVAIAQAGFQVTLHAIGDKANRMALNAYQEAIWQYAKVVDIGGKNSLGTGVVLSNPRNRIEHAQIVAPSDFARFRDLGVVASMQPSHAISDKRWAPDRLGEYRVLGAYSWHTMEAYGVHVPFGTDWPIEPINPYRGLFAAVTRESTDLKPEGGWLPQEKLPIMEAIRCYTAEPAYATFEENDKGQIKPGMLADLVVHTRDLLTVKPEEILQTEPWMTIFDGRVVYERGVRR
ncbi:MAG: amidohydrolase [Acidobacteria bacterium]|nr:amidohydrolase [Acidobacteriota bacterium]